jgi:hypothetical protein
MNLSISALKGMEIGEARCLIAKHALDLGAKYLFFLDDDTAPPYDAVRRLVFALEQAGDDFMVAGGIYANKHSYPTEPMVFKADGDGPFWRWKYGEVFECASIGTGCMLIKTEVFKHLPEPWFKTVSECPTDQGEVHKVEITDDLYFCKKVRDAGFRLLADGGVLPIHWDVYACSCGHPEFAHNKAQLHYPCLHCGCEAYKMTGKHFVLPENSYPFMRIEIPQVELATARGVAP